MVSSAMNELGKYIKEIADDHIHGAGYLADSCLQLLSRAALSLPAPDETVFLSQMTLLARKLIALRPTMVLITNTLQQFIDGLQCRAAHTSDLSCLRLEAAGFADLIAQNNQKARNTAIDEAVRIIQNGDVVITCSFSSMVCKTFIQACSKGIDFQVLASSSSIAGRDKVSYGALTCAELHKHDVHCTVIADALLETGAFEANNVLVGADCVTLRGILLNGTPTLALARSALSKKIPFYCVCETGKIYKKENPPVLEAGFDQVPASLLTAVITERGISRPEYLRALLSK